MPGGGGDGMLLDTWDAPSNARALCASLVRSETGAYRTKEGRDAFQCFDEDPGAFWALARKVTLNA